MKSKELSPYHFLFLILLVLVNVCRNFLWVTPSALMAPMMEELSLTYGQAGQLSLIVTVMMGVFLIAGSYIMGQIGAVRAMLIGLVCIAADGLVSYIGTSFPWIMAGKVLCGIGYGFTTCATTAWIVSLFPKERLGLINGLNTCAASLTLSAAYRFIVPMTARLGSWRTESFVWGVGAIVVLVLFLLWSKAGYITQLSGSGKRTNYIRDALRYPYIRWIIVIISCSMLVYVSMNSYYPNFLHQQKGFSLETASSMVSVISVSAMIGSLCAGAIAHRIRKPKAFIFMMLLGVILCFGGMVYFLRYELLLVVLCGFGFCYTGMSTFCMTKVMSISGISPLTASAGVSMMNAFGSLLAIVVPTIQQALTNSIGMQGAMLSFAVLFVPSITGALLLPQSGKKGKGESKV